MAKNAGINIKVITGSVRATGTLSITGDVADTETVTIGTDVYEFDTDVTPTITAGRYRVDVTGGVGKAAAKTALIAAINANASSLVVASDGGGDDILATAKEYGTGGNAIAKAENMGNGDWDGVGAFLTGGLDATLTYQRGASITVNGEVVDTTTKDESVWRTIIPTWNNTEIQCNGLADINGTTHETLFAAIQYERPVTVHFCINGGTGEYWGGKFYVTNLQPVSGSDHEGVGEFAATFQSTGSLTYV
jgi:hypothetical protein